MGQYEWHLARATAIIRIRGAPFFQGCPSSGSVKVPSEMGPGGGMRNILICRSAPPPATRSGGDSPDLSEPECDAENVVFGSKNQSVVAARRARFYQSSNNGGPGLAADGRPQLTAAIGRRPRSARGELKLPPIPGQGDVGHWLAMASGKHGRSLNAALRLEIRMDEEKFHRNDGRLVGQSPAVDLISRR